MLQLSYNIWVERIGAQQQQQVCTTFMPYLFSFIQFLITFICVSKKFKRRGTRRQLLPRAWT